ncbi:CCA tRNA nucleotidyltransferase [Tepidibacter formicigenes]|jgi:tRNA nucleotidyltransferase (CCA-adding enzyme)|uniref:tRNA nucleotidyltransferase (CCA-adding enzyme) n=1 Tax=Tepidibacter formicigenes DSM 15518 TaxID=1123349 RepID=A0A1M6M877_9FIRM|nr:CCA tRNA nucleotidyltransferase [Tepidibacter formicigenes]SHJ79661.1 tRNA nucleotidyltransferase (CCA-adding enzyme) [Tepidibacter formicigenes DSM 15518]
MKIKMPDEVKIILSILSDNNYEGYIVGGCVRDSLLKKEAKDWDITTNAKPKEVIMLFEKKYKVVPTGLKHGTVTIIINNQNFEVTTYRIEGEYIDNRRPDRVEFTNNIKEDLKRRDFTINAMAYNDYLGLYDPFLGIEDLKDKKIKCVGSPKERFEEDALRILRGVRFATQLNFCIDNNTASAMRLKGYLLNNISKERVRDELCKILFSKKPSIGFEILKDLKLLDFTIPELKPCIEFEQNNPHHDKNVFDHILSVVDNTPNNLIVRLSALLHDIGKPKCFTLDDKGIGHFYRHELESEVMARDILKRLRFDNKTIDLVCVLIKEHMNKGDIKKDKTVKKLINRVGIENIDNLFYLQIADRKGTLKENDIEDILKLKEKVYEILHENQPLTVKDLAINGNDLIKMGYNPGKQIGELLNYLLDLVLENSEINKKDKLIDLIKNKI